jgi:protein tyrosine phosphatase
LEDKEKFGQQSLSMFEAALSGENIDKNRYQSVLPPDTTRVILKDNGFGSDYINANFVDGIHNDSKQAYIATQAPKPDTMDDFFRMCWEQNVNIIVMLTNLEEGGRVKAHQYWPKFGSKQIGSWLVSLSSVRETEAYIVRTLEISQGFRNSFKNPNEDINNQEKRLIYQYHFLVWPDMGVPDDATALLEMIDDIDTKVAEIPPDNSKPRSPLLVHCSAGIGRTGTFVLIDTVIKKIKEDGGTGLDSLDLQPILSTMRDQRPGFVQQKSQYYFCYQSVLQSITGEKINIEADKLSKSQEGSKSKKRDRPSKSKRDQKPSD